MKKYTTFLLLLSSLTCFSQVQRFTTKAFSRMYVIADAKNLETWAPDTSANTNYVAFVRSTYGNNQMNNFYIWYKGIPLSDSTASFKAKHWLIQPANQSMGFWSLPTFLSSYHNIIDWKIGLTEYFINNGYSGQDARIKADSLLTIAESTRAKTAENNINNRRISDSTRINTLVLTRSAGDNNLSTRINNDSIRINTETVRATSAEATKEPLITASNTSTYYRGDKAFTDFVTAVRAALSAGVGLSFINGVFTNTSADQVVTLAGSGYGLKITGTYPFFTITANTPTYNNAPTRTINTSYQLSTNNNTRVSYSYSLSTALSLVNLASASAVFLDISPNGTTWTTVSGASTSKTVTVGVIITDALIYNIQGEVPAGYYMRIRSVLSGGGTVTFSSGQEVNY